MKKHQNIEKKLKSQIRQGIQNAFSAFHQSTLSRAHKVHVHVASLKFHRESLIFGKAPPGSSLSSGNIRGHPPANKTGPPNGEPLNKNQIQQIHINQKSIFHHNLNFKIMNKQILFLAFLVLAAFANVNKSYGQCSEDPLHPIAGKAYQYSVTTTGTVSSYLWFVTDNPAILTGGTLITPLTAAGNYSLSGETTATATITWNSALIATAATKNYYVVVQYVSTDATANCTMENIKAYKIRPTNLFQLDLANANSTGGVESTSYSTCSSDLVTALITDNGTTATIAYDYNSNDMFFKITVRNFSGAWNLTVNRSTIAALVGAGETFALAWSDAIGGTYTAIPDDNAVSIPEKTTTPSDDEVIFLKVTFDHNTFEGTSDKTVALIANATDSGNNQDLSSTCAPEEDTVTQVLLGRPAVTSTTVATPNLFIQP